MAAIFGTINDITNAPVKGASITILLLGSPVVYANSGIPWYPSTTIKTDINGFFTIELLDGVEVDIYIPSMNFRRTIEVPLVDTNLFLMP